MIRRIITAIFAVLIVIMNILLTDSLPIGILLSSVALAFATSTFYLAQIEEQEKNINN